MKLRTDTTLNNNGWVTSDMTNVVSVDFRRDTKGVVNRLSVKYCPFFCLMCHGHNHYYSKSSSSIALHFFVRDTKSHFLGYKLTVKVVNLTRNWNPVNDLKRVRFERVDIVLLILPMECPKNFNLFNHIIS